MTTDTMPPHSMTGADIIGQSLARAGASHAFGIPGGEVLALMQGLDAAGLRFVLVKHLLKEGAALATSIEKQRTWGGAELSQERRLSIENTSGVSKYAVPRTFRGSKTRKVSLLSLGDSSSRLSA